ncbi:hypothetical protein N1F89_09750 [Aquibium sp. A9E412]|uniref:hypothetical protein n=1 Tax=Aquibium sp. A9E412 TaxID=2976767 RepID=UPI0025B0684D|nr:hypothetical protein [Aquibium sp. A9E412]MDN2566506.1 hypothetical protein [Aquibium sp. A9E412]
MALYLDEDWQSGRSAAWSRLGGAGIGALRVTLLFGAAAVALALIVAPIADKRTRGFDYQARAPLGLDSMATGSVGKDGSVYTIRRSVLQRSPSSVCIIRDNGTRSGDC